MIRVAQHFSHTWLVLLSQPKRAHMSDCPLVHQRDNHRPTSSCSRSHIMLTSQANVMHNQHVTPPSTFKEQPLTPPPTDKKPFAQARQAIALFRARQAGSHTTQDSWIELKLAPREYAEVERLVSLDEALSGLVEDKIRYVCSI